MIRLAFRPRLVETLKTLTRASFLADLSAGVTVGIIALPLAMAFAIGSGVKPEAGITTAISTLLPQRAPTLLAADTKIELAD